MRNIKNDPVNVRRRRLALAQRKDGTDDPLVGRGGPHGTLKDFKDRLRRVIACCGPHKRDLRLPSAGKMCG